MTNRAATIGAALRQTAAFVAHVARHYRLFYPVVALTFLVLVFEYAATSLMIPLSAGSSASTSRNPAVQAWHSMADKLGLPDSTQTWLWLFFVVMIARLAIGFLQSVAATYLGKQVHRRMGGNIFSQITAHEPLQRLYTRSAGHYITLAGDDTFRCGTIITSLMQSGMALFTTLVALIILFQFSRPLFVSVVLFLVLALASVLLLFKHMLRLNAASAVASRELNTSFVEALNSIRSIRALGAERFVGTSYAAELRAYVSKLFRIEVIKSSTKALPAILLLAIAAVVMRPGSELSLADATLFAGTIIIVRIFASLGVFVTSGSLLLTDIRAVGDVRELLGRTESADVPADTPVRPAARDIERVRLQDVTFSYDNRFKVLDAVSLNFDRGLFYAIVGQSGSGKSTLADVVLGLVPAESGSIRLVSAAGTMAPGSGGCILVEQHTKLFSGTLRANLQLGLDLPDSELWEALRRVDLDSSIRNMRDGLETVISYQGDNFSGGQRQRIGIARALLRSPAVLIMDEATSALDSATTTLVLQNVRETMQGGILILITHDPKIAGHADVIVEFRRAEDGNEVVMRPRTTAVMP